jgi:aconitate hydratase
MGADPKKANRWCPLICDDHSVQVDHYGTKDAFHLNELSSSSATERCTGDGASRGSRISMVPPGAGIVHQVTLNTSLGGYDHGRRCTPDTVVGTDSHTTMINGLAAGRGGWH